MRVCCLSREWLGTAPPVATPGARTEPPSLREPVPGDSEVVGQGVAAAVVGETQPEWPDHLPAAAAIAELNPEPVAVDSPAPGRDEVCRRGAVVGARAGVEVLVGHAGVRAAPDRERLCAAIP